MARPSTPKLSIAAQEFRTQQARKGNESADMVRQYRSLLGRLARHLDDIHVGSLQPHHLESFFYGDGGLKAGRVLSDGRIQRPVKSTLGRYRANVKVFLDWCNRRGYTSYTGGYLCGDIKERSTRTNRDRFRMDRRQLLTLMDATEDSRDRALVSFAANTGVRIGEAFTVLVKDVRLARGEVYVKRHKTDEEVTYAVTADLDSDLREWLTVYAASLAKDGITLAPDHYLFPARHSSRFVKGHKKGEVTIPEGYKPNNKIGSRPCDIIRPMAARAGIELEDGDGWHTIRRSVGRIFFDDAIANGHDAALRLTQAFYGHAAASTTEGYLGLGVEKLQVDSLMRGKSFITKGLDDSNVVDISARKAG